VAVSAGWGNTTTTVITGTDTHGKVVISAGGSGQGANPTITLTFGEAFASTPVLIPVQDSGDTAKSGFLTTAASSDATKVLLTYQGTPSGTQTYTLNYIVYG
jgi:hypothetical protein